MTALPNTKFTWLLVMPGFSRSIICWVTTFPCWIVIRCTPGNLIVEQAVRAATRSRTTIILINGLSALFLFQLGKNLTIL